MAESGRLEGVAPERPDLTPEQAAEELAKLREARDSGTISGGEYEGHEARAGNYGYGVRESQLRWS